MQKMNCQYIGVRGMWFDRCPDRDVIEGTPHESWRKVLKHYAGDEADGVASLFWGIDEPHKLDYSRIHDLGNGRDYDHGLKVEEGRFVATKPLCGGGSPCEMEMTDDQLAFAAQREMIMESRNYLNGRGLPLGHISEMNNHNGIYVFRPMEERMKRFGCCQPKEGVDKIRIDEALEILEDTL
jgi:hypothetical protein